MIRGASCRGAFPSSLFATAMFLVGVFNGSTAEPLRAQVAENSSFREAYEIRESTERILEAPEFQRFQRLLRRSASDESSQAGDGTDGSGTSEGSGAGQPTGRSGPGGGQSSDASPNSSDRSRDSQDRSSSETDSGFTLPGVGAIAGTLGLVLHALAWICLAAICLLILVLAIRAILNYQSEETSKFDPETESLLDPEEEHRAPGLLPVDAYLRQARQLADQGRYHEAIAQLLLGAMSHIERARLIRYRQGLTHRDYLRAVRGKAPLDQALQRLIRVYEPIGFGRREATFQHFEQSLAGYAAAFDNTQPTLET